MLTIDDMDSMGKVKGGSKTSNGWVKEVMMEMLLLEDIRKGLTCCSLCLDQKHIFIHEYYGCDDNIEDII